METDPRMERRIGLFGATSVGVGAIVGGGILALAGVAFAVTGPSAILAFGLNGCIAILTALSFAEMSAAFPESGGTYTFSKKVLSVRTAFLVGWVVWFASIVAAALYAIGFASFAAILLKHIWPTKSIQLPLWFSRSTGVTLLALLPTLYYTFKLTHRTGGGGVWMNILKVIVFGVLIIGGLRAIAGESGTDLRADLTPFFSRGLPGLFQAMGYSFIAMQGFDLIAAVAGEVKDPARNIPRSMLLSLGIALTIYLPLLFMVSTVGMNPGQYITTVSAYQPEAIVAVAAHNYLGEFGYWLVLAAAILSMLSALSANLFAASRVALAMSWDRTLPRHLEAISRRYGTPVKSVLTTFFIVTAIIIIVPDIAIAGAASSLIFLVTFALSHLINILFRKRNSFKLSFKLPYYPLIPSLGLLACLSLAVFQGIAVPSAGVIVASWLIIGGTLYVALFARRARVVDAVTEATDPRVLLLRGRSPLVLVPIVNPANAEAMVAVANTLAPPNIGRVLLLSVVTELYSVKPDEVSKQVFGAQEVLRESLIASFSVGLFPEALTTVAPQPWDEISRVARTHRCESLLVGLSRFQEDAIGNQLEDLMNSVACDVVVLRAPEHWKLTEINRVLVPVGGKDIHDQLRARLLASLWRNNIRQISFLRILEEKVKAQAMEKIRVKLTRIAREEVPGAPEVVVVQSDDVFETIIEHATESDLVILGLQRLKDGRRVFGELALRVARETHCAIIMISHGI